MSPPEINTIYNEDCLETMKRMPDKSIDFVCTDPPYGYSFMGKDWDKAVPSVEIWQECLRVLKPGAFMAVMSAPRSDVQMHMIKNISEAGFRVDFTPIYWTYASGFPKAGNIGKLVDKRLGGTPVQGAPKPYTNDKGIQGGSFSRGNYERVQTYYTTPGTDEAKALDGSYTGFQPKPAVEVIIVAMKPLSEKTYVDQALKNGKGITWLDDCRVPTSETLSIGSNNRTNGNVNFGMKDNKEAQSQHEAGRFPANLVVQDEVLGEYSKFFNLDKWEDNNVRKDTTANATTMVRRAGEYNSDGIFIGETETNRTTTEGHAEIPTTFPFYITPKASKSEKNKGLEHLPDMLGGSLEGGNDKRNGQDKPQLQPTKNGHPTVKPLKLMSYLITLFSREGDVVLDPFLGSGTTALACQEMGRNYIGSEISKEYCEIAEQRLRQGVLL